MSLLPAEIREAVQLREEMESMKIENANMQTRIDELSLACADHEDAAKTTYDQWNTSWCALQTRLFEFVDDYETLSEDFAILDEENAALGRINQRLERRWDRAFDEHEAQIAVLETKIESFAAYAEYVSECYEALEMDYTAQSGRLENETEKNHEHRRERVALTAENKALADEVTTLGSRLEIELDLQDRGSVDTVPALQTELATIKDAMHTLQLRNEGLQAQNEQLKDRKTMQNRDKFELETRVGEYHQHNIELHDENTQLSADHDMLFQRCENALRKANEAMKGEIGALRAVKNTKDHVALLEQEADKMKRKMDWSIEETARLDSSLKKILQGLAKEKGMGHERLVWSLRDAGWEIEVQVAGEAPEETIEGVDTKLEGKGGNIKLVHEDCEPEPETLYDQDNE